MKQITKFFALAIVLVAFCVNTFAQPGASTTATASATIVAPLAISSNQNMLFGDLAVNTNPGTVQLTAAGPTVRTVTGGVSTVGAVVPTAARFTVTGTNGSTYSTTLPANGTVSLVSGGNTMPVTAFVSNATGSLATGTETFYVGATLNVAASQVTGAYSATFTVTVNYN
jgi:hypothetical protein